MIIRLYRQYIMYSWNQPQNNEQWTHDKTNRKFHGIFLSVAHFTDAEILARCKENSERDYVTKNMLESFSISCFRIVCNFMVGCMVISIQIQNEYWFINSIYGEHNLQKFTQWIYKMAFEMATHYRGGVGLCWKLCPNEYIHLMRWRCCSVIYLLFFAIILLLLASIFEGIQCACVCICLSYF